MADGSKIEWTDSTWNPVRGCSRVSEGCRHCYAERVAARFSAPGQPYEGLAQTVTRPGGRREARWTGQVRFVDEHLADPLRWRKPRRIFVNSMSDLFHPSIPDAWIDLVFAVMALAPRHIFQVLTKRPERMRAYVSEPATPFRVAKAWSVGAPIEWPLRQVWLGVSVEDQATADERIPLLLDTPAAIRWISAEPLLGPVDLTALSDLSSIRAREPRFVGWIEDGLKPEPVSTMVRDAITGTYRYKTPNHLGGVAGLGDAARLDWVVAGGESGPGARPMHPAWARSLRDQCAAAGVPYFFKQWGEWAPSDDGGWLAGKEKRELARMAHSRSGTWDAETDTFRIGKKAGGRLLDGRAHDAWPVAGAGHG